MDFSPPWAQSPLEKTLTVVQNERNALLTSIQELRNEVSGIFQE
jgi:hypothetical protein